MLRTFSISAGLLLAAIALLPQPAAAELKACNRSDGKIHVAVALPSPTGGWSSAGWWSIEPDSCGRLVDTPREFRTIYAYAWSTTGVEWGAPNFFCVEESPKFDIHDAEGDCASGLAVGMVKHDVGGASDYTITFE